MARNVEIKAYARRWDQQLAAASQLTGSVQRLTQEDTFFHCDHGRLKLRRMTAADDSTDVPKPAAKATLIFYQRPDQARPRACDFQIIDVEDPDPLTQLLTAAFGVLGVVRKERLLMLYGATRIHFDHVEGLGQFIEIEVILEPHQTELDGDAVVRDLMKKLDIRSDDLVSVSYIDLLKRTGFA